MQVACSLQCASDVGRSWPGSPDVRRRPLRASGLSGLGFGVYSSGGSELIGKIFNVKGFDSFLGTYVHAFAPESLRAVD